MNNIQFEVLCIDIITGVCPGRVSCSCLPETDYIFIAVRGVLSESEQLQIRQGIGKHLDNSMFVGEFRQIDTMIHMGESYTSWEAWITTKSIHVTTGA